MAIQAEHSKQLKYSTYGSKYHFISAAIETSGVFGHEAQAFIKVLQLGHQVEQITANSNHTSLGSPDFSSSTERKYSGSSKLYGI